VSWGINILALWAADGLWDSVTIGRPGSLLIGAAVLAVANGLLKPLLTVLTLPLIIFTLGIFYLVINVAMVALAEWIAPDFSIDGFWTYVGTVVVIWAVNWVGNEIVDALQPRRRAFGRT
jgi:putative membrane protein